MRVRRGNIQPNARVINRWGNYTRGSTEEMKAEGDESGSGWLHPQGERDPLIRMITDASAHQ